jgi:NADPH:quinone reductase-like Zn-dependent oxidoreductase
VHAVRVHRFGSLDAMSYDEVPIPTPADDEVLVRVRAASVGPWDALVRTGNSGLPQPLPLTLGSDLAGVVESVGRDVSTFRPGDDIFGVTNPSFTGAYAEYAVAKAGSIAKKPATLNFVAAAAIPVVSVTAWLMLFKYAGLTAGQSVLIDAASGSVGEFAVQLAHLQGVRVVASVSFGDPDYIRSLGADEIINLRSGSASRTGGPVDAVIDLAGGDVQGKAILLLKSGGIIVSAVSAPDPKLLAQRGARGEFFIVNVTTADLVTIAARIDSGALRAHVGAVLPLSKAREAHEMLEGTRARVPGKIVLTTT